MSYSYTQRKKTIRRFKEKYKDSWRQLYQSFAKEIRAKQDGPLIGNLQEIMDSHTEDFIYMDAEPVGNAIKEIMDAKRGANRLQEER